MEDGAPVHRSKICEEQRQTRLLEKPNWLANSHDLNPIENLWKILKDIVQHSNACPRNIDALKVVLEKEWKSMSDTKLLQLCHSMPSIDTNGGHTRWQILNTYFCMYLLALKNFTHFINTKVILCQKFHVEITNSEPKVWCQSWKQ